MQKLIVLWGRWPPVLPEVLCYGSDRQATDFTTAKYEARNGFKYYLCEDIFENRIKIQMQLLNANGARESQYIKVKKVYTLG